MELQTKEYLVSLFILCIFTFILVHFPNNLIAISLERLHATFFPFRHRFVRKWVCRAIIIVIWLIAIVREAAQIFLEGIADRAVINTSLYILFTAVSLFVICVSYILVTIKVRCSRHPQFHSRSKRERKLTGTALIVSLVSILCCLPASIYVACLRVSFTCFRNFQIEIAVLVLVLANSLINPIIYAIRMPGFREGYHSYFTGSQTFLVSPQQTCHFETFIERMVDGRKTIHKSFLLTGCQTFLVTPQQTWHFVTLGERR